MTIKLIVAIIAAGLAAAAQAQTWPTKPVRIVAAYAAGGAMDMSARVIAPLLAESLGQSVVVENRVGGAGLIGAELVARVGARRPHDPLLRRRLHDRARRSSRRCRSMR